MWALGFIMILGVAVLVFALTRYFYLLRLQQNLRSYNTFKDGLLKQLKTSLVDKEKFEAMLSSMVEGALIISPDGKIEHASSNFCRLLEMRSKETSGRLYWEVIWNQQINDSLREALLHKKAVKKEINILSPQESFFSMQISPVMDKDGRLLSLLGVFHDITELKKLEKMRTEFVANVSHELKTPLTAIKGFVETLRLSFKEDPQTAGRFLDIIEKQTQRLENLVNDLLALSAIESRDIKMNMSLEPLHKIIHTVLTLQKKTIEDKKHKININVPLDLKVLVDRSRMEQVFLNLLDNAVKFTPPQGEIQVLASFQSPYVRVDIKDTGMGIAPEHLSRVFERFYRVDKARAKDTNDGTGLGLSIVHQITAAHKGKIEVESSPGIGSVFSVFLPYQAD